MIRITQEETVNYRKLDVEQDLYASMHKAIAFTVEPFDDYWENVTYYGAGFKDPTGSPIKANWVYVLVNPGIADVCKIGFTTTSVSQRVHEINSATGVIHPWYPVFSFKCPNGRMLEEEVHEYLEDRGVRVNPKREGFSISSEDAIKIIQELGEKYL